MRLSVRWRLTLWYGAVLAVALAVFGAAVYFTQRQHALRRIDQGLSEELADVLFEVRRARDDRELAQWLDHRFYSHEGFDFQISRPGKEHYFLSQRLAGAGRALPLEVDLSETKTFRNLTAEGSRWRIVSVQEQGPSNLLTIQVARSLTDFDHESQELLLTLFLTGPFTLLIAIGGGYFLAARALSPVEQLRRTTQEITADRLDRRLPVSNPGDELGLLTHTINEMIGRLERSFAEVRRFTADASHELRTPLTAIRTEAELALARPMGHAEQQQLLGSILEECDRLARLTDQLLTLAREDAGMALAEQKPVDLSGLARDVVEVMRLLAETHGIGLECEAAGAVPVHADASRLRQVLLNLVDNAIKYTPARGSVVVRLDRQGTEAVLTVADTGIGIAPEHLPRVFDRFYRVDKARSRADGGSGLGLSIARSIVTAHQGSINLTSTPGTGTVCTVRLPSESRP